MSDAFGGGFGDTLVVDASVAVKWYLKEERHERSAPFMEAGLSGETRLIAPVLIVAELGNVLWQRVRRGEMVGDEVREVWAAFEIAPVDFLDIVPLMPLAIEIAIETGCALYDALYVALAEAEGARLITADRKLIRTLQGTPLGDSVTQL